MDKVNYTLWKFFIIIFFLLKKNCVGQLVVKCMKKSHDFTIPIQKAFGSKKLRPSFKCSSSQSDHILEKLAPSSCVSAS